MSPMKDVQSVLLDFREEDQCETVGKGSDGKEAHSIYIGKN